jgi:putative sterol carrier protein
MGMTDVAIAVALTCKSTFSSKGVSAVAAQDFFDSLESRADASKLAGMSNSYLFDIEGEGQWLVDVRDGAVTVTPGGGEADATITTSGETFEKIVAGEQNPTTAYMTGKLKIKGDMGAAMKLQKIF